MSFSSEVKAELLQIQPDTRQAALTELATYYLLAQKKGEEAERTPTSFRARNLAIQRKYFTLLEKTFNIKEAQYSEEEILSAYKSSPEDLRLDYRLLQTDSCKRTFLRAAFLSTGSMSDPKKGYHLEFVLRNTEIRDQILETLAAYGMDAGSTIRKDSYIVYLKQGDKISDFLILTGASISTMSYEEERVVKEVTNSVNRKVNLETANIHKAVHADKEQKRDIQYIVEHRGWEYIPESLRETAKLRLDGDPGLTLEELGRMSDPPIGKSGVNHRLRKLRQMAEEIRQEEEERI